ncbi:MAG: bifunctional precorrin-2 dehydrogenase/sirohydrochlorin ferrochelatase [Chloroflexota bacterium]|nr:bifunctional precorrin-2 dehydrogenase/sirohydrochlorin ferrochelatase [Chloroflexota bacterium]
MPRGTRDRRNRRATDHEDPSTPNSPGTSNGNAEPFTPYYPVTLYVQGKRCVVIGGGEVAFRKAQALLQHGALVEVISPGLCPELSRLAATGAVRAVPREYRAGDLDGAFVAVAATDDAGTNSRVAAEATERRVLVNVADTPALCSFIMPSCLRRGPVTVAVSTGGKSPALARRIRTELERSLTTEYGSLASLVEQVRSELKERGIVLPGEAWQRALDLDVLLEMLRQGRWDEAKERLLSKLERCE